MLLVPEEQTKNQCSFGNLGRKVVSLCTFLSKGKGKAIPLQAWTGA
jgi:hypothetical protein